MPNIFKLCATHVSRGAKRILGGIRPPGCGPGHSEYKVYNRIAPHYTFLLNAKAPACNCFRTTTNNSFGKTSAATQQLLTDYCPRHRLTRFTVKYTCCCWLNGQMLKSSNSHRRYTFTGSTFHRLSFVSMSSS